MARVPELANLDMHRSYKREDAAPDVEQCTNTTTNRISFITYQPHRRLDTRQSSTHLITTRKGLTQIHRPNDGHRVGE
jgi:hypothetical protein